jgi:hypothetical protein
VGQSGGGGKLKAVVFLVTSVLFFNEVFRVLVGMRREAWYDYFEKNAYVRIEDWEKVLLEFTELVFEFPID